MIRASLLLSRSPVLKHDKFSTFCIPFFILQLMTLVPQGPMVLLSSLSPELLCCCSRKTRQLPESAYLLCSHCTSSPNWLNIGNTWNAVCTTGVCWFWVRGTHIDAINPLQLKDRGILIFPLFHFVSLLRTLFSSTLLEVTVYNLSLLVRVTN